VLSTISSPWLEAERDSEQYDGVLNGEVHDIDFPPR